MKLAIKLILAAILVTAVYYRLVLRDAFTYYVLFGIWIVMFGIYVFRFGKNSTVLYTIGLELSPTSDYKSRCYAASF